MSQVVFILSLVAWSTSPIMCSFSDGTCDVHWLNMLRKGLLATIPATEIFLAKDLMLEVSVIRQASRMFVMREKLLLRLTKVFALFMSMFSGRKGWKKPLEDGALVHRYQILVGPRKVNPF
jgi:hypothetical protein